MTKLNVILAAAMIGAFSAAMAQADTGDVSTVDGCQVVDMGGYSNKVDPNCSFNHQPGGNWSGAAGGSLPPGTTLQDIVDDLFGN
jgi:hypothetical protein